MYQITFVAENSAKQSIRRCVSHNFNVVREGIDTYYKFDPLKGHGVGEKLAVSIL